MCRGIMAKFGTSSVDGDLQHSSAPWCSILFVGTTFWIFVGIALLQAVVGGLAKMAEKRKKAEATAKLGGTPVKSGSPSPRDARRATSESNNQRMTGARQAVATVSEKPPGRSSSGGSRLEELRQKRIEILRSRMSGALGVPSSAPPPTPSVVPPPVVVSVATQPAAAARRGSSDARKPLHQSRSEPRRPISERGAVADRIKPSVAFGADSRSKSAAKNIVPKSALEVAGSAGGNVSTSGRTATLLARRLRNRGNFKQAVLMAELLQPPVGLRSPSGH